MSFYAIVSTVHDHRLSPVLQYLIKSLSFYRLVLVPFTNFLLAAFFVGLLFFFFFFYVSVLLICLHI